MPPSDRSQPDVTDSISPKPSARLKLPDLFGTASAEATTAARPADAIVVFAVMWGMAMTFSAASQMGLLLGRGGLVQAAMNWGVIATAIAVIMHPRHSAVLLGLAALMTVQYALRMPVASNNQTIALFMNVAIILVLGQAMIRGKSMVHDRDDAYERLRLVARSLLATMYFFGIFHKINADFLDPLVSCATALYVQLTRPIGLDAYLFGIYGAIASNLRSRRSRSCACTGGASSGSD